VSAVANRFGETCVIDETVATVELAGELMVLLAPPLVALNEAPGL
jgi:hypothetical protein